MRKLGVIAPGEQVTEESQKHYSSIFDKPLTSEQLAAIRDLFPAARALSDDELSAAAMQINVETAAV